MFNVQGSEIIIILVLALLVLGPEKLPEAIRKFTQVYGEIRKMSNGFQSELRNALDEPLRELRDTADLVRRNTDLRQLMDDGVASTAVAETPASTPVTDPVIAAERKAAPFETVRLEPTGAIDSPAAAESTEANEAVEPAPAIDPDEAVEPTPGRAADPVPEPEAFPEPIEPATDAEPALHEGQEDTSA